MKTTTKEEEKTKAFVTGEFIGSAFVYSVSLFILLKVIGVLTISWNWLLYPILLPIMFFILAFFVSITTVLMAGTLSNFIKKILRKING